jgi:hypothetical protein
MECCGPDAALDQRVISHYQYGASPYFVFHFIDTFRSAIFRLPLRAHPQIACPPP